MLQLLFVATCWAGENFYVTAVGVSPDGKVATSFDAHSKRLTWWDLATNTEARSVELPGDAVITHIDVANGGRCVAGGPATSWLVDVDGTKTPLKGAAALDQGGARLVVIYDDVKLFDVATMTEVHSTPLSSRRWQVGYDVSPDARYAVYGDRVGRALIVTVMDTETGKAVGVLKGLAEEDIGWLAVSPDGSRVIVGDRSLDKPRALSIHDVRSGKRLGTLPLGDADFGPVSSVTFTSDGKGLIVARAASLERWDVTSPLPKGPTATWRVGSTATRMETFLSGTRAVSSPTDYFQSSAYWTVVDATPNGDTIVAGTFGTSDLGAVGVTYHDAIFLYGYGAP